MWDWLSGLNWNSILGSLSTLGNLGLGIYGAFNQPKMPNYQQPVYEPPKFPEFKWEMPEMPEMDMSAFDPYNEQNLRGVARNAVGAKSALQSRGVYSGGAVTPEAMVALLGVDDPNLIYKALELYGKDYGWS